MQQNSQKYQVSKGQMAERSKAPRSGRGRYDGVGSNPTLVKPCFSSNRLKYDWFQWTIIINP